jgi:hypothetical protein
MTPPRPRRILVGFADSRLGSSARDWLEAYFGLVQSAPSGVLAFELRLPPGHGASRWHGHVPEALCERCWTKGDT